MELPLYRQIIREKAKEYDTSIFLTEEEIAAQTHSFMLNYANEQRTQGYSDALFFLDKGARPISYLFRKLYPYYCPDIPHPQIYFLNIGRPKKGNIPFRPYKRHNDTYNAWADTAIPTLIHNGSLGKLDANRIAKLTIVDDYSKTGETQALAYQVMRRACPQSIINSYTVYNQGKVPAWQGYASYAGVREYTTDDYRLWALREVNETEGTSYESYYDAYYSTHQRAAYNAYHSLEGLSPVVRTGEKTIQDARADLDLLIPSVLQLAMNSL